MVKEYVIQAREDENKGRSFLATCVAVATANSLWADAKSRAQDTTIRPVWAMFAGTEQQLRPFVANLKSGRKAEPAEKRGKCSDSERLEFLRSSGFLTSWQREPEGALVTLYHPELFRLDPGLLDPVGIDFLLFVPTEWASAQQVDVEAAVQHVHRMAPKLDVGFLSSLAVTAYLFAAYLDRRTRCPIVPDGRFYLQLLVAALDHGLASLPGDDIKYSRSHSEWGRHRAQAHGFNVELLKHSYYDRLEIGAIGFDHMISFTSSHAVFEQFLADQVTLYFAQVKGKARRAKVDLSSFAGGLP
jgi:hypothetical protein